MSTQTATYYDIVSHLPAGAAVTFIDVSWHEYEDLIEQLGEASHLRIDFSDGVLQVMTLSFEHERYVRFFEVIMTAIRLRFRIKIISSGSMTMRSWSEHKGGEPDASFYVQNADRIGGKMLIDLDSDPPPDIAVEVDVHHQSVSKFAIYAALLIPEVWRFDGGTLTIYHLDEGCYRDVPASLALPFLTSRVLTDALARLPNQDDTDVLMAFDEWLQHCQWPPV